MRAALLLVVAAAGCGAPEPEEPGQAAALGLVWRAYGATAEAPLIEWRAQHCPGTDDGAPLAVVEAGACYAGLYLRGDRALVARRGRISALTPWLRAIARFRCRGGGAPEDPKLPARE